MNMLSVDLYGYLLLFSVSQVPFQRACEPSKVAGDLVSAKGLLQELADPNGRDTLGRPALLKVGVKHW